MLRSECFAGSGDRGTVLPVTSKSTAGSPPPTPTAVHRLRATAGAFRTWTFVRYVLKGDLYGYEEWVKLLAFWLYFMGAAIGAYNRTHVSADLVHAYLPPGIIKKSMIFLKDLVTVVVTLLFVWYGYDFFMFGFMGPLGTGIAIPKTTIWRISLWTSYLAVFSGLIFMALYFTRDLVLSTLALFGRDKK